MSDTSANQITRREMIERMGMAMAVSAVAGPLGDSLVLSAGTLPLNAIAGVDRIVMAKGRTYLNGWAGYGEPPRRTRGSRGAPPPAAGPAGPPPAIAWSKASGPGNVTFADPKAAVTTATFSTPGDYVLQVTADNGTTKASSTLAVTVELPPPATQLTPVWATRYAIDSPLWDHRVKSLIVSWIPHCIDQMNRSDLQQGPGGLDNFIEAAKALRGEPHGAHKGYVFSNAWVHQTVEAMSLALMVDAKGDREILAAQDKMRATLDDWIPRILAAQHPNGYLQTAFTLADMAPSRPRRDGTMRPKWTTPWSPEFRGNHEGYTAGYFIESAINHYSMTDRKDARLYDAAKKLADCWADHIGPPPKQEWFDGHQEMEQALVRFGRFVNEVEGHGRGDRYIALAKFLLDSRKDGTEYDQSHLPVVQQYEAVGHAVRAAYTYSGMADVAVETHDTDYQSAVKSLWDNIVHRKYYLTGGIGSGETSEGFGPDYSLRNRSYCESCSSCGEIFFQWKMHLAYHDARYADLYEQTLYNGLLGSLDLKGENFYYQNRLDANEQRTPWHVCPCCVGNISRTLLMLPTWMYSKGTDAIYVNLFAGSTVRIGSVAGTDVEIVQTTDYPWKGNVSMVVNPSTRARFAMRIRVPSRDVSRLYTSTPAANGIAKIAVNGAAIEPDIANGYATIVRTWKAGDRIDLELPLTVQRIRAIAKVEADRGRVALRYGPLVYNIERVDQDITGVLSPSAPLKTQWRPDLLNGVVVITGTFADGKPLLAIPNYARYNRNPPAPPYVPPPSPAPGQAAGAPAPRPAPPPPESIIWMREL